MTDKTVSLSDLKPNFQNKEDKELWNKITSEIRKLINSDPKLRERIRGVKTTKELTQETNILAMNVAKKLVEGDMPSLWIGYIDKIEDGVLRAVCLEKQQRHDKPEDGWDLLPSKAKRVLTDISAFGLLDGVCSRSLSSDYKNSKLRLGLGSDQ